MEKREQLEYHTNVELVPRRCGTVCLSHAQVSWLGLVHVVGEMNRAYDLFCFAFNLIVTVVWIDLVLR